MSVGSELIPYFRMETPEKRRPTEVKRGSNTLCTIHFQV